MRAPIDFTDVCKVVREAGVTLEPRIDTPFVKMGLDSLELVELAIDFETRFGIDLPRAGLSAVPTPGALIAYANSGS